MIAFFPVAMSCLDTTSDKCAGLWVSGKIKWGVHSRILQIQIDTELHETLSEEIFWMMTHRETEFMKFAQKLRDNIRKKWKSKEIESALTPANDDEILEQLREHGQQLIEFR